MARQFPSKPSDSVCRYPWGYFLTGLVTTMAWGWSFAPSALTIVFVTIIWLFCTWRGYSWFIGSRSVAVFFVLQGCLIANALNEDESPNELGQLRGSQASIEQISRRDGSFYFRATINPKTSVFGSTTNEAIQEGSKVWITGPFKQPKKTSNFGDHLSETHWWSEGEIFALDDQDNPGLIAQTRQYLQNCLSKVKHPKAKAVLSALVIGSKQGMSPALRKVFSEVGGSHLLAVSGLHIVGFALLAYGLMLRLAYYLRLANCLLPIFSITLSLAYLMLCICHYPVGGQRALAMFFILCLSKLAGRRGNTINTLLFAASILIVVEPEVLWRPGFLLSFAAVFGIITRAHGETYLTTLWRASLWSCVTTACVTTYFFGGFSPLAPFTNLILVPFVTLILMPITWFALMVGGFWTQPLALAGELSVYLIALCEQLEAYGVKNWWVGYANWMSVAMIAAGCWLWRVSRTVSICVFISAGLYLLQVREPRIDVISVGQGDSALVSHMDNHMLIDAGPEHYGQKLVQVLRRLGVNRLQSIVLTHGHTDHYLGLTALIEQIPIKTVIWNGRPNQSKAFQKIMKRSKRTGTSWLIAKPSRSLVGNVAVNSFPSKLWLDGSENDASIAVKVSYRQKSMLFTGDLEGAGEKQLLTQINEPIQILRGGHHGSRSSSLPPLLGTLCPSHLILSMGLNNRFGFPHREALQRADVHGAEIWRTDRDGRISIDLGVDSNVQAINQPIRMPFANQRANASTHCRR